MLKKFPVKFLQSDQPILFANVYPINGNPTLLPQFAGAASTDDPMVVHVIEQVAACAKALGSVV